MKYTLLSLLIVSILLITPDLIYTMINKNYPFEYSLHEHFLKVMLLSLALVFINKKIIRLISYFILSLIVFIYFSYYNYFGRGITAIDFYLFYNNIGETFDSLLPMMHILLPPFIISLFLFISLYIVDKILVNRSFHSSKIYYIISIFVAFMALKVIYLTGFKKSKLLQNDIKYLYPVVNRVSFRNFYVALNRYLFVILPKSSQSLQNSILTLKEPKVVNHDLNRTIIFVIGESQRCDFLNSSSPYLKNLLKEKNFYFKEIFSGGTMTKVSFAVLTNRLKKINSYKQVRDGKNSLFYLASKQGFYTSFISNQNRQQLQFIREFFNANDIDLLAVKEDIPKYIKAKKYDEDLLSLVKKEELTREGSFTILQQRGAHSPYFNYPKKFHNSKSDYENCSLYTAYNIYSMIQYLKKHLKHEFFFIYTSDHGELLGEGGKHGHGYLSKEVYKVPLIIYTNSHNIKLQKSIQYIKCHYDLSNYIIQLLGYEADLNSSKNREFIIMNSDLEGFSGYAKVKIKNNKKHIELIK